MMINNLTVFGKLFLAFAAGLFVATMLSTSHAQSTGKSAPPKRPELGILNRQAPEWTVNDWHQLPDGKESISLKELKGKVVYVYFFQSWCPGCHSQGFPTLKKVQQEFADDKGVAFVTIQTTFEGHSSNTSKRALATAQKFDLKIPVGHADSGKGTPPIMKDYRSGGTPWIVIIDKNGVVRFNDFSIKPKSAVNLIKKLNSK